MTDYTGEEFDRIADPRNILHKLLPQSDEGLLEKIDWYGDTYFNDLQIKPFLEEGDQLGQGAQTPEENELVDGVRRLAKRCQEDRSLLRFIGD